MVLIDLDPNRAAGISASKEEFEKAHLKAVELYRYLMGNGFKEPMITTSGNGYHLYIPCDMPNDDSHNELVKRFLQSLSKMFSGDGVEIDEKVFNPARIDKLIGTWAKKGSDTWESIKETYWTTGSPDWICQNHGRDLTFDSPGTYYVASGPNHTNYTDAAPAICVVTVRDITPGEQALNDAKQTAINDLQNYRSQDLYREATAFPL